MIKFKLKGGSKFIKEMFWGIFPKDIWGIIFSFSSLETFGIIARLNKTFNSYCKNELFDRLKKLHVIKFDVDYVQLMIILKKKELSVTSNEFYLFGETNTFYPLFITSIYHGGYLFINDDYMHFINSLKDNYVSCSSKNVNYEKSVLLKLKKENIKHKLDVNCDLKNSLFFMNLEIVLNPKNKWEIVHELTITFIYKNRFGIYKQNRIKLKNFVKKPEFKPNLNWNQDEFIQIPMCFNTFISMMDKFHYVYVKSFIGRVLITSNNAEHLYKIDNQSLKEGEVYKIEPRLYKDIVKNIQIEKENIMIRFQTNVFQIKVDDYLFSFLKS